MKSKELLIIKLGGSVITNKNKAFTPKLENIKRLTHEIKVSLKLYKGDLIVVHGSGSFGHTLASKYQTQRGIIDSASFFGLTRVADTAIAINRIVMREFIKFGLNAVSFAPLSFILSEKGDVRSLFLEPIKKALELGFVPVLYGDVVFDTSKRGFCIFSGEKTITALLDKLKSNYQKVRVVYCADTDGVYDSKGKTVPIIDFKIFAKLSKTVNRSDFPDVTGGMLHKVKESLKMVKERKIECYIINGERKNGLRNAIVGLDFSGTKIVK
jgi:isopentenyl phosphate kinase